MLASLLLALALPASAAQIKALSFNVAGIPLVHPRVGERMKLIAGAIERGGYDLAAIQEAWFDGDARTLTVPGMERARTPTRAGLLLLSRWPITETDHVRFAARPSPLRIYEGEWPAEKGALFARVRTPSGPLDVYDTHLISYYPDFRYTAVRFAQLFELSELIEKHSASRPFLLLGDLNARPGDADFETLAGLLSLEEAAGADASRIDHAFAPAPGGKLLKATTVLADPPLSDHAGLEVVADPKLLAIKPRRDAARREKALRAVMARMDDAIAAMSARERRLSWIPLYGFFLSTHYDRQRSLLFAIRSRAETALIRR